MQIPLAGAFWLDRFGMIHANEPAQPLPRIAASTLGDQINQTCREPSGFEDRGTTADWIAPLAGHERCGPLLAGASV